MILIGDIGNTDTKFCLLNKNYKIISNEVELEGWLKQAEEIGEFTIDTETNSLDPHQAILVGISISSKIGNAFYIPLNHTNGKNLSEKKVLSIFKPFLLIPRYSQPIAIAPDETITTCFFFLIKSLISLVNCCSHFTLGFPISSTRIEDPILITIFLNLSMYISHKNFFYCC